MLPILHSFTRGLLQSLTLQIVGIFFIYIFLIIPRFFAILTTKNKYIVALVLRIHRSAIRQFSCRNRQHFCSLRLRHAPKHRESRGISHEHDRYLFDCDHIIDHCSNIQKLNIQDQTDSMLEVRLTELDSSYKRLKSSYESLILSPATSDSRDFKENAKLNVNIC